MIAGSILVMARVQCSKVLHQAPFRNVGHAPFDSFGADAAVLLDIGVTQFHALCYLSQPRHVLLHMFVPQELGLRENFLNPRPATNPDTGDGVEYIGRVKAAITIREHRPDTDLQVGSFRR